MYLISPSQPTIPLHYKFCATTLTVPTPPSPPVFLRLLLSRDQAARPSCRIGDGRRWDIEGERKSRLKRIGAIGKLYIVGWRDYF